MGKAIDALENALIEIQSDGEFFLNEEFMNDIFKRIYTDDDGNAAPLQPLEDAMQYMFEEKQTNQLDGSKVLPYDVLNAELFYPTREENIATTEFVTQLAVEVADCMLQELRDPKKATSDYLSSGGGKFSWGETTDEDHIMCIGKMATNDPAESPFASLTVQLQSFGRVLGIHSSGVGHARVNGDFKRDHKDGTSDGAYLKLSPDMRQSLLRFALSIAPRVRKSEKTALDKQHEAKKKRQNLLRQRKMLAAQEDYANALTLIDMFYSPACWRSKSVAKTEFEKLPSRTAKLNSVKEQIRIRVKGFGWTDLHHPWSENGVEFSPEHLLSHLMDKIIPEQNKRQLPIEPTMNLPSRKHLPQLGTQTLDVAKLEERYESERETAVAEAIKLREQMENEGATDRHERLQPSVSPAVNEDLIGSEIEILYSYKEPDGSAVDQWCQGIVVAIKTRNRVHIQWRESTLREGDLSITEEVLMKSKWNKHVLGGWRYSLDSLT